MFQSFNVTNRPEDGPSRLAALRAKMAEAGLDGFLVPRSDAHQGETVAARDGRLAWLTGFSGSAGFCAVLEDIAGVFVDGRYRVQVRAQVDLDHFTPVNWPQTRLGDWLGEHLLAGGKVGFDPWLHTVDEIEKLRAQGLALVASENLVDAIWPDQPPAPLGAIRVHPLEFAGEDHASKREAVGRAMALEGDHAAVLTLPDSIAWLLNIRGSDVAHTPVPHAFAILHGSGAVDLFCAQEKLTNEVRIHLGESVACHAPEAFGPALDALSGPVRLDKASAPVWVVERLSQADLRFGRDPCMLPKARKNTAELSGMEAAHLRDAAAMCRFLCWLDDTAPKGGLTEIDMVTRLEIERRRDPALQDISFDTIAGAGPNGAIVHYRVTEQTNRTVTPGDVVLVDSGGQYADGTTDITRTVATGPVSEEVKACFTRVLQGMISISTLRWPRGLSGRDLDALARAPLWRAGLDYDHGTGHGVGACLSVHEGPQRISRISEVPLQTGMILSNEPGCYCEGRFGIRIENLIHVIDAPALHGADDRDMLAFATLTWVPIDRRLIAVEMLSTEERAWIDDYHERCRAYLAPSFDGDVAAWLDAACAKL